MIIVYTENPLAQKVILDDRDREILRLKIRIDDLEDKLTEASMYLEDNNKWFNVERARKAANFCNTTDDEIKKRLDKRVKECEEWLMDAHCGDCVCVPASCVKCYAEGLLGISTVEYISTSSAYRISTAFYEKDGNCSTCEEAITYLKNHPPEGKDISTSDADYIRWCNDHQKAIEYLEKYKKEKLS